MQIAATQLRPGMVVKFNNDLFSVFKMEHRTPGNLRGFVQVKMRNFKSGTMIEHRFSSEDKVEKASLDEQEMEYLYDDGEYYYFMNTETFEQMHLVKDLLGDATDYLTPNLKVHVEFYEGKPDQRGVAGHCGPDRGRNRTGNEGRIGFERHQGREAGDRSGGAGASVHQRGREDPGFHVRRFVSSTRVRRVMLCAANRDDGDVVHARCPAERGDRVDDFAHQIVRRGSGAFAQRASQTILSEFIAGGVGRLRHAVRIEQQSIARVEAHFFLGAVPFLKRAQHGRGWLQPRQLSVGSQTERRAMAAIGVTHPPRAVVIGAEKQRGEPV